MPKDPTLGLDPDKVHRFEDGMRGKTKKKRARKMQPTSAQVHVAAPLGDLSVGYQRRKVKKKEGSYTSRDLEKARQAGLVTMAKGVEGTSCANCRFADGDHCSHPSMGIELVDGADKMCCNYHDSQGEFHWGLDKVQKDDPPADDDIDVVAKVAVMHDGSFLMGKRADNGKWDFPGGRAKDGEDARQGAQRELEEETGIEVKEGDLEEIATGSSYHGHAVHVFRVDLDERPPEDVLDGHDDEMSELGWFPLSEPLPQEVLDNLHTPIKGNHVLQALDEVTKDDRSGYNWELSDMQELVNGMDYEMASDEEPLDEHYAAEVAAMNLSTDPDYYKKKILERDWTDDDLAKDTRDSSDTGFRIDLGSGLCREPGHIGFDLYPYDYGTVTHDLDTGIPMPTGSVEKARYCNVDGYEDSPDVKALLSEIHRVLMPGGEFVYQGPNDIYNYPEWTQDYPGLVLVNHEEMAEKARAVPGVRQTFTRVAVPDPATANDAEPRIGVAQFDMLPADALLAMDAVGYFYSDATSSGRGNRLMGYPSQGGLLNREVAQKSMQIFKADRMKQVVYCVALAPNEVDSQEDYMEPQEIESTAHGYMQGSRVIGSGHERPIDAFPVESYIAPQDIEYEGQNGPQVVKQGSWVLGIKVNDPEEWEKVMSGEYTGISVGGQGVREEVS